MNPHDVHARARPIVATQLGAAEKLASEFRDCALTVNVIGVKQCERFKIEDFDDIKGIMFESESEMYLWVKTDVREVQTIASILVHSEKNIKATDLTQHLVNDFLIDISKVFSSRLQSSVSACDAENLRSVFSIQNGRAFRSGHLLVTLNINENIVEFMVNRELVKDLLSGYTSVRATHEPDVKLINLSSILSDKVIQLEVLIGNLELSVSSLASLQINDVIYLDKNINEKVTMKVLNSGVECKGYPVQCEDKKALRLVS